MNCTELAKLLENGRLDGRIAEISGVGRLEGTKERYLRIIGEFAERYGADREIRLYSVPGRSELSGNHTDHNRGKVIAGSVDLDIIAAASPSEGPVVRVKSEGFPEDSVDLSSYMSPDPARFGRSESLIAGVSSGLRARGYEVGGFDAVTTSNVLKGSGLSSSAAFENMIGLITSDIYSGGPLGFVELAQISQYAENVFFGKPCGLMDQVACAAGGEVAIDFADPAAPVTEKLSFDFSAAGYRLCIINTGGNHADLTADYAAVPAEMKAAAAFFGKEALRDVDESEFVRAIPALREAAGDRAVLRAIHFFEENRRVDIQRKALREGNLDLYLENVIKSGRSSYCYLQNVFSTADPSSQGVSLALCLCEKLLSNLPKRAAWRVHGGGFAGTVQAYVPDEAVEEFREEIEKVFGAGSVNTLKIRQTGAVRVI